MKKKGYDASRIERALLSKGYFPKELPPVFTTADFGANISYILNEWEANGVFKRKCSKDFAKLDGKRLRTKAGFLDIPSAEPEVISKPKRSYERRNIHITHPVPQALLVNELSNNWAEIQKWLSIQIYSEDKIISDESEERGLKQINFSLHRAKTNFIECNSDWLVKTDITRFYPSIYTHSIPWAAYGKEKVKRNRKLYDGSLADRLDVLVRSCNRNQTIGLPIGPETSRIIAEVLSSRIDLDFTSCLMAMSGNQIEIDKKNVDRLQDDWTVGVSSLERAEHVLSGITKCYREYGLEINGSKTSINHILISRDIGWKSEISSFLLNGLDNLKGSRLDDFFSLCLRLQLSFPSESILNYTLAIIEGRRFQFSDLGKVEAFLLKSAAISPNSLDRICRIILNIQSSTSGLSKKLISDRFISLAERHIENGALYEVIWLLFTIRGLKQPFRSVKIMDVSENIPSSALRLLLLDMDSSGLCIKAPAKATWQSEISMERCLSDWTWLYAYEAVRKGWLKEPQDFLKSGFLAPLNDCNVVFYNTKKNVKKSEFVRKQSFINREKLSKEISKMSLIFRGLENHFDIDGEY